MAARERIGVDRLRVLRGALEHSGVCSRSRIVHQTFEGRNTKRPTEVARNGKRRDREEGKVGGFAEGKTRAPKDAYAPLYAQDTSPRGDIPKWSDLA